MKFQHREPDEFVNVSPTNPLREALVLASGLGVGFGLVVLVMVLLADRAALYLPVSFEQAIFGFVGDQVHDGADEPDPYLTDLVTRLAVGWDDNPYAFQVWLIEAEEPNALALPGGTILVTRPLLGKVSSENGLALVLGHELGHFRNRDHLRGLSRQMVLQLLLAGFSGGDKGTGWIFQHVGLAASSRFNRAQETACDAFGLGLIQRLYGHVSGATEFFEAMIGTETAGGLDYLRTHPVSNQRIRDIESEARRRGYELEGVLTPLSEP